VANLLYIKFLVIEPPREHCQKIWRQTKETRNTRQNARETTYNYIQHIFPLSTLGDTNNVVGRLRDTFLCIKVSERIIFLGFRTYHKEKCKRPK
jgi:hypothetical protein